MYVDFNIYINKQTTAFDWWVHSNFINILNFIRKSEWSVKNKVYFFYYIILHHAVCFALSNSQARYYSVMVHRCSLPRMERNVDTLKLILIK